MVTLHLITSVPVVADVFSFGPNVNNAIYRILLEETDDNTATFEGSIEYEMLNQINIDKQQLTLPLQQSIKMSILLSNKI